MNDETLSCPACGSTHLTLAQKGKRKFLPEEPSEHGGRTARCQGCGLLFGVPK